MTKIEQIRHGYNDGQTIFRRQSVEVLLARIEELEKQVTKLLSANDIHLISFSVPANLRRVMAFDISGRYYENAYYARQNWYDENNNIIPIEIAAWCEMEDES